MKTKQAIATGLALALASMAAPAMASGPGGHGQDDGGFPGLPDQALFGICNAFGHADDNATAAPPFQWLSGATCQDASHPAEDERPDEDERRGHAGPPR